jgi:plastocyanin
MAPLPTVAERTEPSSRPFESPARRRLRLRLQPALAGFCLGWSGLTATASAGDLNVIVKDPAGRPVENAVVYAMAPSRKAPRAAGMSMATMDQRNKEFVPHVLTVQMGTAVAFPNNDNIRHHVYSFSPAKVFDLPLYAGTPVSPMVFDKPGVVVLGCNIHDWMLGYVFVPETPYFDKTSESGAARLRDLPAGQLEIRVWHPQMTETPEKVRRILSIPRGGDGQTDFVIALAADPYQRRRPAEEGAR